MMLPDDAPPPDATPPSTEALRLRFNVWLLRAHTDRRPAPTPPPAGPAATPPRRGRRRRQA